MTSNQPNLRLSILIVAYNAGKHLPALLQDMIEQTYPRELRELLLIDGMSSDGTKSIMESFRRDNPEENVRIFENPKRILSAGWNIGIENARGHALVRFDAHCRVPCDYLEKCVRLLQRGETIVGGRVLSLEPEAGWIAELVYLAETSRFGAGAARFRNPGPARHVDTLGFAVYSSEVFRVVGKINENVLRAEDNEFNYRARRAGFRFFFDPDLIAYRFPRDTFFGLLRQMFGNGYSNGICLRVSPGALGIRHLVPAVFVFALFLAVIMTIVWSSIPLFMVVLPYLAVSTGFALKAAGKSKKCRQSMFASLPMVVLMMHILYGFGTILGLIGIPVLKWRIS